MDIDTKRRGLRALLSDPANGFIMSDEALLPPNRPPIRYIDVDKLIRNRVVFGEFSQVLSWEAREIQKDTPYDRIVTTDQRASTFAHGMGTASGDVVPYLIQADHLVGSRVFSDAQVMLRGRRCLVVTDVIVSGHVVHLIVARLRELVVATPVAVLAAIKVGALSHPLIVAGQRLPVHSATNIDFDAFSSSPETLYSSDLDLRQAVPIITDIDAEFMRYFARHPEELYNLNPRTFEKLVAHILEDFGYDIELTKATRDGGSDIIAYIRTALSCFLVRIECKKYAAEHKVGIDIVRSVLGVQELAGASKSIIVTTSYFTKDASKTARQIEHRLELKDYTDLKAWLARYA
jgi:HJR/Mrr/RecB family endonuclease/adenine/guanine phosphoribosyltransferase-like PRPP-binding protein